MIARDRRDLVIGKQNLTAHGTPGQVTDAEERKGKLAADSRCLQFWHFGDYGADVKPDLEK